MMVTIRFSLSYSTTLPWVHLAEIRTAEQEDERQRTSRFSENLSSTYILLHFLDFPFGRQILASLPRPPSEPLDHLNRDVYGHGGHQAKDQNRGDSVADLIDRG